MTHADIVKAIESRAGRIVASFVLDADGRTVGGRSTHNKRSRCSACGEVGHIVTRCNGKGNEPRAKYEDTRSMSETRRILAERRAARMKR